jgi:hypothetical protein
MVAKFSQRSSNATSMNLIGAFQARTTGFANINLDREMDVAIESNQQTTQDNIRRL